MYLKKRFRIFSTLSLVSCIACVSFLILLFYGPRTIHVETFIFSLVTFTTCLVFLVLALILHERMKIYSKILQHMPPHSDHCTQDIHEVLIPLPVFLDVQLNVAFIRDPVRNKCD